jgi:hypothetical protein
MPDVQVTCIKKHLKDSSLEGISHLGGPKWQWTTEEVITSIEAKTNTFFTLVGGNRSEIGIVNGPKRKYLRTYADGKWNDNLLSLPQCP